MISILQTFKVFSFKFIVLPIDEGFIFTLQHLQSVWRVKVNRIIFEEKIINQEINNEILQCNLCEQAVRILRTNSEKIDNESTLQLQCIKCGELVSAIQNIRRKNLLVQD